MPFKIGDRVKRLKSGGNYHPHGMYVDQEYIVKAVDFYNIQVHGATGWWTAEYFSLAPSEPKKYTVREMAEAVHAIAGVPKQSDFEDQVKKLNDYLEKVNDPKYKEAEENLTKATKAVEDAAKELTEARTQWALLNK